MVTESGLGYTLRPPKSYTKGRKTGQPSVIVIHTTEGHEGATSAEDGAAYDARRTDGTSTHFFVDANSIIQCVFTTDEAHAARAHGNDIGIQIEICGSASQAAAQWNDTASAPTLKLVAKLCAQLRRKYGPARFPLTRLTPSQVRSGGHGFCGHVDITNAFPEDNGTHTDPGKNFPWGLLFTEIKAIENPPEVKDMQLTDKIGDKANPNRTVGDVLRDVAKWRGIEFGDSADTKNAGLKPTAPLALLNGLPARVTALEAQAKSNGGGISELKTQITELKAQVAQAVELLQSLLSTPPTE